jgi:pSer/pThr/pTyr-binding forkhead associated (FHA) protein
MQAVLVMFRSDGERRSFSIARDMTVIGRREDCDLRIPLGEVSRKHCRLVRDGDSLHVEDLGSSNGTYHNGQRVQESILGAGDSIQVGPVVFVLQLDGVPADDQLQPALAQGVEAAEPGAAEVEVSQAQYADEDSGQELTAEDIAYDESQQALPAAEQAVGEPVGEGEFSILDEIANASAANIHLDEEVDLDPQQPQS